MSKIERIDIKSKVKLEYYHGRDKQIGLSIIQSNDMLQYHYLSQEYGVIKSCQLLVLITIEHNNIKTYIGFMALNPPTLNKKFRNYFFGKNFLKKMYTLSKQETGKVSKILNITRLVFIPSFRGLGIAKYVQDKMTDELFQNKVKGFNDVQYIEITSMMLHTFDFSGNTFNKTFINIRNAMDEERYNEFFKPSIVDETDTNITLKGFKGVTKRIGTMTFRYNNINHKKLFDIYLKDYYNLEVTEEEYNRLFDNTYEIFKDENKEILQELRDKNIPLMFTNIMSFDECLKLKVIETPELEYKDESVSGLNKFF